MAFVEFNGKLDDQSSPAFVPFDGKLDGDKSIVSSVTDGISDAASGIWSWLNSGKSGQQEIQDAKDKAAGGVMADYTSPSDASTQGTNNPNLGPLRQDYVDQTKNAIQAMPIPAQAKLAQGDDQQAKIANNVLQDEQSDNSFYTAANASPSVTNTNQITDGNFASRAISSGTLKTAAAIETIAGYFTQKTKEGMNALGANFGEGNFLWDQARINSDMAARLAPEADAPIAEKVGFGVAAFLPDLLLMGEGKAPEIGEAVQYGWSAIAKQLGHGAEAMRAIAVKNATNVANDVLAKGGTQADAIKAATTSGLFDLATGGVAMGASGSIANRVATGIPTGVLINESRRQAMNAALPENQQEAFSPSEALVGGLTQGILHGAMGSGETYPSFPDRAELGSLPKLNPITDAVQSTLHADAPAKIADIGNAQSVDEAIQKAQDAVDAVKPTAPVDNDVASQLNAIRPVPTLEQQLADIQAKKNASNGIQEDNTNDATPMASRNDVDHTALPDDSLINLASTGDQSAIAELSRRSQSFDQPQETPLSLRNDSNPLTALSDHDEIFKLPKSSKDTVEGIASDNDAGIKVQKFSDIPGEILYKLTAPDGQVARIMERRPNPYGDSIYGFQLKDGEMHAITEGRPGKNAEAADGKGDVYIDVSNLDEGTGFGAKMYNIAATYAHNTGKVFIGDPAGLSDMAMYRRPEQMLSSALKFGTTDHLAPHPRQVEGDASLGVPGLDWIYGDHEGNIRKLIDVNQANIENAGGNGDIAYNKNTGQFEDANGNTLSRADIDGVAKNLAFRTTGTGGSTLARHALFKSILQGLREGVHGPDGSLEALRQQLRDHDSTKLDSEFRKLFYSRRDLRGEETSGTSGLTTDQASKALAMKFGKGFQNLQDSGILKIVQSFHDLPVGVRQGMDGTEGGVYYKGTGYIVADNQSRGQVVRDVIHEIGEHHGLQAMMGDQGYANLLRDVALMKKSGNPLVNDIWSTVKRLYDVPEGSETFVKEVIAKLGETAEGRATSLWSRITIAIKQFLNKAGLRNFNERDVADLVTASLRRTMNEAGKEVSAREESGEPALASNKSPTFYSQLERSIDQAPDRIFGPAKQVKLWLESNAPKLGIKKDELQWSGITDWLDMRGSKVSKQDVMDYLANNGVKVQEVIKGDVSQKVKEYKAKESEAYAKREKAIDDATWFMEKGGASQLEAANASLAFHQDESGPALTRAYELLNKYAPEGYDHNTINDATTDLENVRHALEVAKATSQPETKYKSYVLPGGENYRELLLTLPPSKVKLEQWKVIRPDGHVDSTYASEESARIQAERRGTGYTVQAGEAKQLDGGYRSSHWDEPNIVAHVRFDDRTDADGKKVLMIHELQSDWGQQGKKQGFKTDAEARFNELKSQIEEKHGKSLIDLRNNSDKTEEVNQDLANIDKAYAEYQNEKHGNMVPSAPFVTKTESWLGLGIKRMIRYAASHGYDKIAFVNGEQSADRYDLSKQVDRVELGNNPDGTFKLRAEKGGQQVFAKNVSNESEAADIVGKEVARKLFEAPEHPAPKGGYSWKELSGLDLKVGGEGMKTFYDKIVPQTANDVLKKLGGGKVGEVTLRDKDWQVKDKNGNIYVFDTYSAADDYSEKSDGIISKVKHIPQPGFEITPAMREKAMQGQPLFSKTEKPAGQSDEDFATSKLAKFIQAPKQALTKLKVATVPIGTGTEVAQKMATDFADQQRTATWQWNKFDTILKKNYDESQLEKMWVAADHENDLRREGKASDTLGLNSLTPDERKTVETLHAYGEALLQRARDNGMFEGEGVPYWTPRMAVMISDSGTYSKPQGQTGAGGKEGRNLTTSSSSLKQRKYLSSSETEAAMKARLNTGEQTAELVKNIRTMPMAMARLEKAIAGRELVNQIKALGQATGEDLVSNSDGPNFFTIDHPALKKWGPDFKDDGTVRKDEDGNPIMVPKQLYISKDFEGPIKAVLTGESKIPLYNGMMELKSKSMGLIMMSPMIHNAVEYGRAVPAMLTTDAKNTTKNILTLGAYTYISGNRAKQNTEIMRDAISHGLVPIGGRGAMQDITGIADPASMEVGKSWTAKALGAGVGLIAGEKAELGAKKMVDAAGRFWHETLLWDRVADLQMGLYVSMRTSLINKGLAESQASTIAAHFANRYAGALPAESMSQGAREILNLALFSRSFTMGNLGAMKDMIAGMPKNRQAQIKLNAFEVAKSLGKSDAEAQASTDQAIGMTQSIARKKAVATFVLDVGLMYVANSLMQDWLQREKLNGWDGWKQSYADRAGALYEKLKTDPLAVVTHPFNSMQSLTSTSDNPEGKEERIKWGEDSAGNSIYMRLPFGKIGEEFVNYTDFAGINKQIHNKLSPMLSPLVQTFNNDKGFGKKVYDDSKDATVFKQAGQIAWNFMKAQVPYDMIKSAADAASGHGDEMDTKKLVGPLVGLTFSKLTGGDAVAESYKAARDLQDRKMAAMDDVHHAIKYGNEDKAYNLLESAGLSPKEINQIISSIENPRTELSKYQLQKFNQHATEDQKAKMDRLR